MAKHHIVIGSGVSGNQAAETLRKCDPESRISVITAARLPFYNRYDLPKVIRGTTDWRDFVIYPPEYYRSHKITLRRTQQVEKVDIVKKVILLKHKEQIHYDSIIVATGAKSYIPPELAEYKALFNTFGLFSEAVATIKSLPKGGEVVIIGGDIYGIDIGKTFIECGYKVTIIATPHAFLPHIVDTAKRADYLSALAKMKFNILDIKQVGEIVNINVDEKTKKRTIKLADGKAINADVIMPFFGRQPVVDFIASTGMAIERGILVKPDLSTTVEGVYAAGDVCQVWREKERDYHFYAGWKNLKAMGELAAKNVCGGKEEWRPVGVEELSIDKNGIIQSPFWEHP